MSTARDPELERMEADLRGERAVVVTMEHIGYLSARISKLELEIERLRDMHDLRPIE